MKITILTYGSRGDVQPFLALACGLQKRGHEVILAAPHRFAGFVGERQVPFIPLAGDPEEISLRINDAGTNVIRIIASFRDYVFSIAPQVSKSAFAACEGADLIVHSLLFTTGGHSWAREHGVPDVSVQTFPMFASTREFPSVAAAYVPRGPLSYLSHWLAQQAFWLGGNSGYAPVQRAHPEIPYPKKLYWPFDRSVPLSRRTPLLCACSPSVLPRPADWPEYAVMTGYLFLDHNEDDRLPAGLADFLSAGQPPVCVTFGSMVNRETQRITRDLLSAIAAAHRRAIVLTGWGRPFAGLEQEDVFWLESAPHHWLLPRCSLVVHHGGAGTTAAGFRAGIPQVIVPHTADQPFWGRLVHQLGVGPLPLSIRRSSVNSFASALAQASEIGIRNRARALGEKVDAEHGVETAVQSIEDHFRRWHEM